MIAWFAAAAWAELPGPLTSVPYTPPKVEVRTLSDGLPVLVLPRRATGTFDLWLVVRANPALDPEGAEGLVAAAFSLATQGAAGMDAATLSSRARAIGVDIATQTTGDWSAITIHGLRDALGSGVELWSAPILDPTFADPELELLRATRIQRVQLAVAEPAGAADRVQQRVMYGTGYLGPSPTEASLGALTTAQVRDLWSRVVVPGNAAVVAGGDLTADELVPLLEARFATWKGGSRAEWTATPAPVDQETVYVVDVKGAPQSALRAFETTGSADDPQRAAFDVAVEALGGAFGSRINKDLREDKGWTYGARCATPSRSGPLFLSRATLVRANVTGPALAEMRTLIRAVASETPLTAAEVTDDRTALLHLYPSTHETVRAWVAELADQWVHGRPTDWTAGYLGRLAKVQPADADQVTRKWVAPDRLSWVVAGDLATIRPQLDALGLPIVVVTP